MTTFEKKLNEWLVICGQIRALQEEEKALHIGLFNAAFPKPKEGTNTFELRDGRIVKGEYKINYKVDEAAVFGVQAELAKFDDPQAALLFRQKHELSLGAYRKLTAKAKKVADKAITKKPASIHGLKVE